ncbi:hypothetical protein GGR54DRAFT_619491 [Hypoxylon sp. NC1633]|nr:hypothetical protein GGR54DRAFT_619491 [Hypoxylon sp. NC1633]
MFGNRQPGLFDTKAAGQRESLSSSSSTTSRVLPRLTPQQPLRGATFASKLSLAAPTHGQVTIDSTDSTVLDTIWGSNQSAAADDWNSAQDFAAGDWEMLSNRVPPVLRPAARVSMSWDQDTRQDQKDGSATSAASSKTTTPTTTTATTTTLFGTVPAPSQSAIHPPTQAQTWVQPSAVQSIIGQPPQNHPRAGGIFGHALSPGQLLSGPYGPSKQPPFSSIDIPSPSPVPRPASPISPSSSRTGLAARQKELAERLRRSQMLADERELMRSTWQRESLARMTALEAKLEEVLGTQKQQQRLTRDVAENWRLLAELRSCENLVDEVGRQSQGLHALLLKLDNGLRKAKEMANEIEKEKEKEEKGNGEGKGKGKEKEKDKKTKCGDNSTRGLFALDNVPKP